MELNKSNYQVLGSCGSYYIIYFLFIIFFGSFYLINLVLAVVAISYEQEVLSPQEEKVCYSASCYIHTSPYYPYFLVSTYQHNVYLFMWPFTYYTNKIGGRATGLKCIPRSNFQNPSSFYTL